MATTADFRNGLCFNHNGEPWKIESFLHVKPGKGPAFVRTKIRNLNTGTEDTTRVLIESTDKTGKSWFTVGVSPNIIEASFRALIDSLDYKLYKEKAPANLNEK